MSMKNKFLCLLVLVILFSVQALSASVGAAPGFIDFGEVESGETIEKEIYVITNFERSFEVKPAYSEANPDLMFETYGADKFETSQEDISEWVSLETVEVNGSESTQYQLEDGSSVNSNGEFIMNINIPEDAEPGWHYGSIDLNPQLISDQTGRPGAINWGETRVNFRFRVEGKAERQISVQDVRAFRLDQGAASVELLLRNSGTVTVSTENFSFNIYDSAKNQVTKLDASGIKLSPEESQWVDVYWHEGSIDQGAYQIDGEVDYLTGQATASGSFSLPGFDVVEVRPDDSPAVDGEQDRGGLPLWLVAMILVLLGVLMWSFGIDPFWILLIVGIFGISAFILMSGISNYLLILLLMVVGIVVYGGL